MPIDLINMNGFMNTDDASDNIGRGQHKFATNGRFRGADGNFRFEGVPGNVLVPNSNLPAGTNQCIGSYFDPVNQRILWFNYNSNGRNGIYQYSISTQTVTKIFLCFTDTATDILNFSLNYPIHSCAIVYRTTGDGDLLYWTDNLNKPRYLNLDTVSSLAPFTDAMICAAKIAPTVPPLISGYFSDATVPYNSVKNKLFRFAYRWVFKNGEKSTFSPISTVPLPNLTNPNLQVDSTLNNYIIFSVYSPSTEDYKAIEVFGQQSDGSAWGDFFQIDLLDRTDYNIPVSSSYAYNFYNNGSYVFVDPIESGLRFSYLPDLAETLESLNGNVIVYGNITDGYDPMTRAEVNVTVTSSLVAGSDFDKPAFKWGCDQRLGLVYFDDFGKTNGVVSFITDSSIDTTDFSVTTPQYASTDVSNPHFTPQISATINHTPPTWATSYQWVRVNLTPKFLHWVTQDYQTDTNYLYLGIENLVQMNAKSGFLPTYDYNPGDRVKIIARLDGDNTSTIYDTQQDYPILGIVQKTMTTPATLGAFIKVPKPSSFPSPAYSRIMLIEIYTPLVKTPDNEQLFYEWGQRYAIYTSGGNRYHRGQLQDQTASQAATFAWTDGDVYLKQRPFYIAVPIENNVLYSYLYMMDANWNDYVPTASNSNGRAWVIDPNAKQITNSVQLRWGKAYQQDTNINQLNIFYPTDFDTIDLSKGPIEKFLVEDRLLYVYQNRAVGNFGIFAKYIQNNEGQNQLVTTNEILTSNNINYLQGEYGTGGQPTGLVAGRGVHYFADPVRGYLMRRSGDGLTPISELYKGQYFIRNIITPFNRPFLRTDGSNSKILGYYDYFEEQYVSIFQEGTLSGDDILPYTLSFNEKRNAFCSFYDFHPEWATCAEDVTYTWLNGQLYIHNNETQWCNFYGTQFYPSITLVYNDKVAIKKTFEALAYQGNQYWVCPLNGDIITSQPNPQTGFPQISQLKQADFDIQEGLRYAAFLRDANSMIDAREGVAFGDYLKGVWIETKLTYKGSEYSYLYLPYTKYDLSSRNL